MDRDKSSNNFRQRYIVPKGKLCFYLPCFLGKLGSCSPLLAPSIEFPLDSYTNTANGHSISFQAVLYFLQVRYFHSSIRYECLCDHFEAFFLIWIIYKHIYYCTYCNLFLRTIYFQYRPKISGNI